MTKAACSGSEFFTWNASVQMCSAMFCAARHNLCLVCTVWMLMFRALVPCFRVLDRAVKLLAKAEVLSGDKVDRVHAAEQASTNKKLATTAERQRVLAQIKDDHALRSLATS